MFQANGENTAPNVPRPNKERASLNRPAERRSAEREVRGRHVASDLMNAVDVVLAQGVGMAPDRALIRCIVDAERADVALLIYHDVAVFPGDLREPVDHNLPDRRLTSSISCSVTKKVRSIR